MLLIFFIIDSCPETGEVYRLKGKTDIPRGNYIVPDADEDWDFGMLLFFIRILFTRITRKIENHKNDALSLNGTVFKARPYNLCLTKRHLDQ